MRQPESGRKTETRPPEIQVTIHYADKGPSLESRMVSILGAHLSKQEEH